MTTGSNPYIPHRDVESMYMAVSGIFGLWSRIIEIDGRKMEAREPLAAGAKILIVAPPNDISIPILAEANAAGTTILLCFSERLAQIAQRFKAAHKLDGLEIRVAPFFQIPFEDGEFAGVYTGSFFDFCGDDDIDPILREMHRVLMAGGNLYTAHMDHPQSTAARAWVWAFRTFDFLSKGVRPTPIKPHLGAARFELIEEKPVETLGFPMRFTHARKQSD